MKAWIEHGFQEEDHPLYLTVYSHYTIRPKIKGGKGIRGRQIECDGMNGFSLWSIFFLSLGA